MININRVRTVPVMLQSVHTSTIPSVPDIIPNIAVAFVRPFATVKFLDSTKTTIDAINVPIIEIVSSIIATISSVKAMIPALTIIDVVPYGSQLIESVNTHIALKIMLVTRKK